METGSCARVLDTLIKLGETQGIPLILLRPRAIDAQSVFDGDFDFLIDEARFSDILSAVFYECQKAGISFLVRQISTFKRQIELLDPAAGRVTLELWSHAEFRSTPNGGHLTRAALSYQAFAEVAARERISLLGAIFLLHLHHKQKDLRSESVQSRLDFFIGQVDLAPALRGVFAGIKAQALDLRDAHGRALAYLRERHVRWDSPWRVLAKRLRWSLGRILKWPALRTSAVVGPDGSGKTALIIDFKQSPSARQFRFQRFKRFFRRPLIHILEAEPRNVRDEKMLWLILPVAWTYFSLSRWLTGWTKPLLLDRYFYDYFLRNVRSKTLPMRRIGAYDLCTALAPRPCRLIIASCPVAIIHERKLEMTEASIAQLYRVYLEQVVRGGIPETLCCYTGASLDISSAQVAGFLGGTGRA